MKTALTTITNNQNVSAINDNFTKIADALNNGVLWRGNPIGEPNQMGNLQDMDGHSIINLGAPTSDNDAARLKDVKDAVFGPTTARLISFDPYSFITALNVQKAIEQVADRLQYTTYVKYPEEFGAVGNNPSHNDGPGIQAAIDAVAQAGGGKVILSKKYYVSRTSPADSSWDNAVAVWIKDDNVALVGEGAAAIVLQNGANCHVIKVGQRVNATITPKHVTITNIEIDGNYLNQATPDANVNHWSGIDVASGCSDVYITRFNIHDVLWYGIGMERDQITNCTIADGKISRTGVDSIDWKDDSDSSFGNILSNVTADNWGLLDNAISGDPAVAFDLRSGITADKLVVKTPSSFAAGGIRLQNGTPGALPYQATKVLNWHATGARISGTFGIRVISRNAVVANGYADEWDDGVSCTEPDVKIYAVTGYHNVTSGFRFWSNATAGTKASTNEVFGITARNNGASGVICDNVSDTQFIGSDIRSNTTLGYDIRANCSNIHVIAGSCTGNGAGASAGFSDLGTGTIIRDVIGYRTKNAVVTPTPIAIDSTGTKTITIPHGLPFTPSPQDVQMTLYRSTNVGDVQFGILWVTGTDATNVTGQVRVVVASATAGAVVNAIAYIDSKSR